MGYNPQGNVIKLSAYFNRGSISIISLTLFPRSGERVDNPPYGGDVGVSQLPDINLMTLPTGIKIKIVTACYV